VLDPNEAVENLNQSKMIGASIKSLEGLCHLNSHKCKDIISGLNHVGWATIAIHGSDLSRYKMNILHPAVVSEMELNDLLQKVGFTMF
jgi:hypothetical protein